MNDALRIVFGDGQPLFVEALSSVLRAGGHSVVATASSFGELVGQVAVHGPDVCITEAHFADADCAQVVAGLLAASPQTMVIVLTADDDPACLRCALDAGARGYVHKSHDITALLDGLYRVRAGAVVTRPARTRSGRSGEPVSTPNSLLDVRLTAEHLTGRERECLTLLVAGRDTTQIAHQLGISPATVRSHVQGVLTKLGARTRTEAASLAIRHDLLTLPPTTGQPAA